MPKPPAKPRRKHSTSAARKPEEPVLTTEEPVYQEPDYGDIPNDLLQSDWPDALSNPEMVPLDKDSIMS